MAQHIYGVTEINQYVKALMDGDGVLRSVLVAGEVSNFKPYPSGHRYFSLKDPNGSIRCVMFSRFPLAFQPVNGMKVVAAGQISVYPRDGAYQLYCQSLAPAGAGDLEAAFEQLKAKLEAEGLFDPAHKKRLPRYPRRIVLVTSGAGAAVHDMIRILGRRYPAARVLLLPVRVQGAEAPPEIAGAIRYANRWRLGDVMIVGRGGGSREDLWAFNDERVARAIYDAEIPVISAVGHEPDVTIADFVADVRAATPTHAAELAAPDQAELREKLQSLRLHILRSQGKRLELLRRRLDGMAQRRVLSDPMTVVQDKRQGLDYVQRALGAAALNGLAGPRRQAAALAAALDAMSPLKVLSRGFALVTAEDGQPLRRARDVPAGSRVAARLSEGTLLCRVEETITEEELS